MSNISGNVLLIFNILLISSCAPTNVSDDNFQKAERLMKEGLYGDALTHYNKAIKAENNEIVYRARGKCYYAMNDYDRAMSDFNTVLSKEKDDKQSIQFRGRIFAIKLEFEKAAIEYGKSLASDSNNVELLNERGLVLLAMKEYYLSVEDFNRALKIDGSNCNVLNSRSRLFQSMNQHDLAIKDCEKAIVFCPGMYSSYLNIAISYFRQNDYTKAIYYFNIADSLSPNNSSIIKSRGITYNKMHKLSEACSDFETVQKLGEEDVSEYVQKYCK